MANKKYCVLRTDLMSGTKQPADLVSMRYYGTAGGAVAEVENGMIVELMGYEEGEREVMKCKAATSKTPLDKCAIVAGVEVDYDDRKRNLEDYVNEAGKIVRGYIPRVRNVFSVTAEGFEGKAPTLNQKVTIGTAGKLKAGTAGFGVCSHIETVGNRTWYAIHVLGPDPVPGA